ncbi:MAG: tetratricopeptide repeat protein [Algiphilus sp.]
MRSAFFLVLLLLMPVGHAAVYVPERADTVLLRVAPSDEVAVQRLRQMRAALADTPGDAEAAADFAQAAITHARRTQDPRWYGYAEGALQHWQGAETVPAELRVLRATLAQHDHQFSAALQDLDHVLRQQPQHLQARLTRAVIHSVQARYTQAITDCEVVRRYRVLLGVACMATPRSLSGEAEQALRSLQTHLQLSEGDAEARLWAYSVRAAIGWRLGRAETEDWFREALASVGAEHDMALHLQFADFLLTQGRHAEAAETAQPWNGSNEGLILSLRARMGSSTQDEAIEQDRRRLEARLEAERARGGARHFGTEAAAALYVQQQPERALWLAQRNWTTQKTPADARLLLRAALASRQAEAAAPVRQWRVENGVEDQRLDALLTQLGQTAAPRADGA